MDRISVCIPAYNEENTIEKCINSILNQKDIYIDEILVGINGSSDNTKNILEQISKKYIKLKVVDSDKGKANAWNAMNRKAANNFRVFIDGDCLAEENALNYLIKSIKNNKKTIVGATLEYICKDLNVLSKSIHFPKRLYSEEFDICGAMYIIDYNKLKHDMRINGFCEMPNDIIAEDRWLALVASSIGISRNAIVYTKACSIDDQIKRLKRMKISEIQLNNKYNYLVRKFNGKYIPNKTRIINQYKLLSIKDKALYIFYIPLKKIVNKYVDVKAKKLLEDYNEENYVWEKIHSSRK